MYKIYEGAAICYAFLADVHLHATSSSSPASIDNTQFRKARWFSRGWTLQELIAPPELRFYDRTWQFIDTKEGLLDVLHDITHVDVEILDGRGDLSSLSIAKRMSWAAYRSTTRQEDRAYCLLGIFNINMPLLYGEGGKAFQRLQEEIIRTSSAGDHSILAWVPSIPQDLTRPSLYHDLLAHSPYAFRFSQDIISWRLPTSETFELTHNGLRMRPHGEDSSSGGRDRTIALNCRYSDQPETHLTSDVTKRFRVDVLGAAAFTNDLDAGREDLFDRNHGMPGTRVDWKPRFFSIHSSRLGSFARMDITLAKSSFKYFVAGKKVHITLDSNYRRSLDQGLPRWIDPMLELQHRENGREAYGYIQIQRSDANETIADGHDTTNYGTTGHSTLLRINVDIMEGDEAMYQPLLSIRTWDRGECLPLDQQEADYHVHIEHGDTGVVGGAGGDTFEMSPKLVSAAGEMMWSLNIKYIDPRAMMKGFRNALRNSGSRSGSESG